MSVGTYRDELAEIQTFILLAEAEELIRQGEAELRAYRDQEAARAFIDAAEAQQWIDEHEDEEHRYNHNHDSKGRFARSNSGLTSGGKSATIDSRGDVVALEYQRYGRNKDTLVNKTYIESGEYRRKFDNITDNPDVNRALYQCSKEALNHRSGTKLEDMYWLNENGNILCSELEQTKESQVEYSKKSRKLVEEAESYSLITLHNHPESMPPSAADFNSVYDNKYKLGVVICHDGTVYKYKSNALIDTELYTAYIANALSMGKNEKEAQLEALNKFVQHRSIEFEVV